MTILPHVNIQEMQLIQEIRQQRNKLNYRSKKGLLNPVGPIIHKGAPTQQQSPSTDQEMDKIVGQLKSLRLTKTELAVAVQSIPFLNQIQKDPKRFTSLLNQAAAQSLAPEYKD